MLAPRAGIIAFAGSVPGSGRSVTIRTADGYSVTLVHLGSLGVRRSASVAEGDPIGTLGRSGDAEWAQPYLHLGVRLTSDPNGYVDPLRFLPPRSVAAPPAPAPAPVPSDPEAPRTGSPSVAARPLPQRCPAPPRWRKRRLPRPAPAPAVVPTAAEPPSEAPPAPAPPTEASDSPTAGDPPALTIAAAKRTRVSRGPRVAAHLVRRPPVRTRRRPPVVGDPEPVAPNVVPSPVRPEARESTPVSLSVTEARPVTEALPVAEALPVTEAVAGRGIAAHRSDAAPGRRTPMAADPPSVSAPRGGAAAGLDHAAATSAGARAAAAARRSRLRAGVGRTRASPAARLGPGPDRATPHTYHFR